MERSSVIVADDQPHERHVATLTLKRGATTWAAWSFDAEDAGTVISVGGSAGCDWPVAAPGVGPLLVLFTGESLLIKNDGSSDDVWLNGARLWPSWVPLEHGDLVALGASSMQIAMLSPLPPDMASGERQVLAGLPQQARDFETDAHRWLEPWRHRENGTRSKLRTGAPGGPAATATARLFDAQLDAQRRLRTERVHTARAEVPNPQVPDCQARVGTARLVAQKAPAQSMVPAVAVDTGSRADQEQADDILPTILGDALPPMSRSSIRRGMLVSLAVALAYAGWVVLLDHI